MMQSSANSLQGDLTQLGRSLVYTRKSTGPSTVPCGTPEWTGAEFDDWPEYDLLVPSLQEMGYPLLGRPSYPVVVEFEEETTMGDFTEGPREV